MTSSLTRPSSRHRCVTMAGTMIRFGITIVPAVSGSNSLMGIKRLLVAIGGQLGGGHVNPDQVSSGSAMRRRRRVRAPRRALRALWAAPLAIRVGVGALVLVA